MTETQKTAKKDLKKDLGAKARMSRHRHEIKELGFKHVSTHLPMDDLTFLDREKKIRGLATRGLTVSSLLAELRDLRQFKEERATS